MRCGAVVYIECCQTAELLYKFSIIIPCIILAHTTHSFNLVLRIALAHYLLHITSSMLLTQDTPHQLRTLLFLVVP